MKFTSALFLCVSFAASIAPVAYGQQGQQQLRVGDSDVVHNRFDTPFDTPGSNTTADDSAQNNPSPTPASCDCGAGHCDQRGCGPGSTCGAGHCNQAGLVNPSCGAGHCNQEGAESPTCGAGHCNQRNAVNPTCGAGHCCQEGATNASCGAGQCNCNACIGGDTLLFSCTVNKIVPARDVKIGDEIRALKTEDGSSVCSGVYYVFSHKGESDTAIKITPSRGDAFTVSYDHIVYVGDTFEERRPIHSQDLQPGDKLVTTALNNDAVEVVEVENVGIDLVNVLTIDPHLEIQMIGGSSVIISAHSVDEAAYGALFAPIRYTYLMFGASAVEYMNPLLNAVDYSFAQTGLRMIKMMTASEE